MATEKCPHGYFTRCYDCTPKAMGYRIATLERELGESNAVCMCGCAEHESYGEDGESCGVDSHDCIRVSESAAALYDRLQRKVERLTEAIQDIPCRANTHGNIIVCYKSDPCEACDAKALAAERTTETEG